MDFPYKSTKTFHQAFPVAYRQWRADSHCNMVHGYALTVHLEFGGFDLDVRNWLVDFGSLRGLKEQLADWFDHTLLVAEDDPQKDYLTAMHDMKLAKVTVVAKTGCEGLSDFIFEHLNDGWLKDNGYGDRIICTKVEVRETDSNMAMRCLTSEDLQRFCGSLPTPPEGSRWQDSGPDHMLVNKGMVYGHIKWHNPGYSISMFGGGAEKTLCARTPGEMIIAHLLKHG